MAKGAPLPLGLVPVDSVQPILVDIEARRWMKLGPRISAFGEGDIGDSDPEAPDEE